MSEDEKEIISKTGRYNYCKMTELNMTLEEFEKYQFDKKRENALKRKIGYKKYFKLKAFNMTIEQIEEYIEQKKKDKELIKKLGYKTFEDMKKSNAKTIEEYEQYKRKQQELRKEEKSYKAIKKQEKDKIRFKTIRYIQRYCELEMKCQICDEQAEIHHPNYKDYLKINLLCKNCHTALHNFELIPPTIIDLEKIAIKEPPMKGKKEFIEGQIENIKLDILDNGLCYRELNEKYKVDRQTIKRYLEKEDNWEIMKNKLEEAGKKSSYVGKLKHKDNPVQRYRLEHNLSAKEFANISQIPVPTIRVLEQGKTDLRKVKSVTKKRLEKLGIVV